MQLRIKRLGLPDQLQPVHDLHADVGNEDLDPVRVEIVQRCGAVFCLEYDLHTELLPRQKLPQSGPDDRLVVYDHDLIHSSPTPPTM